MPWTRRRRSWSNSARSSACNGSVGVRYLLKISRAASASGRSILILTSSRPGRRIAGSIMSSRFEAPMMITLSRPSTPSISLSSWGTMVFSTSEETPDPRVRNSESISSKKTITGMPSDGLVPGPLEDQPDVPLGLPDVLVQQLGALDVEEEAAPLLAGPLGHLLGQRVGHRLGDQRLAAAGRAVEQDALRAPSARARRTGPCAGTAARPRPGSPRSGCPGRRSPSSRCPAPPPAPAPRRPAWGSARTRSAPAGRSAASRRSAGCCSCSR